MESNFNQTIPLQYYRVQFTSYLDKVSAMIKKVCMSELKENTDFQLDLNSCISQLMSNFISSCGFYMPLDNSFMSYFWKLCQNRKQSGIYIVDFESMCGVK